MTLQQPDGLTTDANLFLVGNSRLVNFGATEPTLKNNGDLWFEPGAYFPQPWTWDSSVNFWLSNPILEDFGSVAVTGSSGILRPTLNYGVNTGRLKILRAVIALTETSGLTHSTLNYYTFNVSYYNASNALTTLYTLNTRSDTATALQANGYKTIQEDVNLFIPGDAKNMRIGYVKTGASTANMNLTAYYLMRYTR